MLRNGASPHPRTWKEAAVGDGLASYKSSRPEPWENSSWESTVCVPESCLPTMICAPIARMPKAGELVKTDHVQTDRRRVRLERGLGPGEAGRRAWASPAASARTSSASSSSMKLVAGGVDTAGLHQHRRHRHGQQHGHQRPGRGPPVHQHRPAPTPDSPPTTSPPTGSARPR